jgi:hypothetical protein
LCLDERLLVCASIYQHSGLTEKNLFTFWRKAAMVHLRAKSVFITLSLIFAVFLTLPATGFAQSFRVGISGSVTDASGAVISGAQVEAIETATNVSYKTETSSAGEYVFSNLPLGDYTVSVAGRGFTTKKINKIAVLAGSSYTLPVVLTVASNAQTVLPDEVVQDLPNSDRDFTHLIGQTTGYAGTATGGGGYNFSVNGSRSNAINWEIEGTDNNDLYLNIPAVNQTGINGIAGTIFPIDAIENFSFVTSGTTQLGRSPGGVANLTIKAGTNALHGSAYYYNHNEFFQKINPFASTKSETRNQHYGFSVGGPIWRDKTFFFLGGEHQGFLIGAGGQGTEPSAAYQTLAYQQLDQYSVAHNQVAANLLKGNGTYAALWPAAALTGPAKAYNYTSTGNDLGHSFNGVIKLDERLTDKDHISFAWFVGQGSQTAPTTSELAPYFQKAPMHIENYSLVYNRVLSTRLTNQLAAGVSYFNQVFSDANTSFDPSGLGLDTGVNATQLPGSPHLIIGPTTASTGLTEGSGAGFDPIGVTSPSGRTDVTGHLDEDLLWTKGAHQFHFGGEFRKVQVDDITQDGQRGTLYFDGSQGPWSADSATASNVKYLADFLAGYLDPTYSGIVLGDAKRLVYVNDFALYAQDTWQVNRRLSLNYGLRYDYEGPPHTGKQDLSVFDPSLSTGLAVVGKDVANIYSQFWGGFSPRVGFAYQLDSTGKTVLRGGYGFYEDSIFIASVLENNDAQNISEFGPEYNPAGNNQVAQAAPVSGVITSGVDIFHTYQDAISGTGSVKISTFDKHLRPSATQQYDLNIQHSFTPSVFWQLGYVGTQGSHLLGLFDINPAATGTANLANPDLTRPYYSKFPQFTVIDEARSNLGSNYNSLQTSLRVQNWRGLSSQLGYTWSHALDYETGFLPYVPQNPLNEKDEYGNSDFDVRNTFTGYADYQVPNFRGPRRLTNGWVLNSGFSFHGGTPYTVTSSGNPSQNGEGADRAVQVLANPLAGVSHAITGNATTGYSVQWFNTAAFVDCNSSPSVQCTYSPTRRGQNYNPGYADLDLAVAKNTHITERVSAQFRADIFNLFNHTNLAPVGLPTTGDTGQIGSTLGVFLGNPGIGPGEPENVQFSLKILF